MTTRNLRPHLKPNSRAFTFTDPPVQTNPAPVFHRTLDDVVYDKWGAPLRTDGQYPLYGAHEAALCITASYDWKPGARLGVDSPYPNSTWDSTITYSYHNVWGQVMPIAGGMPAAHRGVRLQVDSPQAWHLESGAWISKMDAANLGNMDGGYWNGTSSGYSKTVDWPSSLPNAYWRKEASGGYSIDMTPTTNADGTPKLDTCIAHFFWNGFFPRVQIKAGSQVAIVTRYRLISDDPNVDLTQANFIGCFSGDAFETANTSIGSNGRNPTLGMPRHKIIGPNWRTAGFITGSESQIRGYPTMPFLV